MKRSSLPRAKGSIRINIRSSTPLRCRRARRRGVKRVWIYGLAQDVCVRATALDAVEAGFETHVRLSATRPVTPADGEEAVPEMVGAGVIVEGD
jgi:nicotinamidase-related amidase